MPKVIGYLLVVIIGTGLSLLVLWVLSLVIWPAGW